VAGHPRGLPARGAERPGAVTPPATATNRGRVVLTGTPRPPAAIDITPVPDCVDGRRGEPLLAENLRVGPGGGLRERQ